LELDPPASLAEAHEVHSTIYDKTLSYYFKQEYERADLVSPIMNEIIERGFTLTPEQYQKSLRRQEDLCRDMDGFLSGVDALISLSTAGEAPYREERELPDPGLVWTLTHLAVMGVPAFVSPGGLPFGMQIAARRYNDYRLFRLAGELRRRGLIPEAGNPRRSRPGRCGAEERR
jgi:Asp-tRNA(Asn)/Glu-tRNA(Gln) amidotransferase A subunit family amidase